MLIFHIRYYLIFPIITEGALAGAAQWTAWRPVNQKVLGSISVRAHSWVVGQVPSRGRGRGNHTLMFLPHSSSLRSK